MTVIMGNLNFLVNTEFPSRRWDNFRTYKDSACRVLVSMSELSVPMPSWTLMRALLRVA